MKSTVEIMENRTQRVRSRLSEQISNMEGAGFGYLGPVLRAAIFSNQLTPSQWEVICDEFDRQNPE